MMNEVYKCSTEETACHPDTRTDGIDPSQHVTRLGKKITALLFPPCRRVAVGQIFPFVFIIVIETGVKRKI